MEMLGKPVSERFIRTCVLTNVYKGTKDPDALYGEFVSPDHPEPFSCRLLPDLDVAPHIGHAVEAGFRMVEPGRLKSKYPRRFICDSLSDPKPF